MENKKLSGVEQFVLPLTKSIDAEQVAQAVARVLPETVDQQQVIVQVIVHCGMDQAAMDQRFQQHRQETKQDMQEIVGQTEAREVKRDERLHKRVDFIRSVVMFIKRHIVKISLSAAGTWSIFFYDVLYDLAKEVIKIVAENKLGAIATGIQLGLSSIIDSAAPIMVPVVSVLMQDFELHRKTATALLQVAAFSLNHTVFGWTPVRRGLAFIRSIFASK
jgi:hypothetical protein